MKPNQPLEHGKYYHLYNRGINSDFLFREKGNYEYFLKLYETHIDPIAFTYAWCLMKNHFHFLVRIRESNDTFSEKKIKPSQSFSNLFNAYTKAYNKNYHRHGALFERPFKRKEIRYDNYLQNVITYIHNNPVNHGICEKPIQYPWSSYLTCLSDAPTTLQRKEVITLFHDTTTFVKCHEQKINIHSMEAFLGI